MNYFVYGSTQGNEVFAVQVKYTNPDDKRVNVTIIGTDDYLIGGK